MHSGRNGLYAWGVSGHSVFNEYETDSELGNKGFWIFILPIVYQLVIYTLVILEKTL